MTGVDRLIIGVVEEEVKPATDKSAERAAAKAARVEEKAAVRAIKQEERAAARAHRDAAKAAARSEKAAGRPAHGGGRLAVLRMRRANSGPDINKLTFEPDVSGSGGDELRSSPDRDPALGSASPSTSPDSHLPSRILRAHGRSKSQHLPDLPNSDGELDSFRRITTGSSSIPSSSPLRISHQSPSSNGQSARSPFAQGTCRRIFIASRAKNPCLCPSKRPSI